MPAERTIGNYVLGPILGRGGMSEVHAAEHRFLGDRVAIKLLRSQLAADPAATAAFVAEATRTRAIDHPGVVRVIDVGSDGDAFYLVMERLDGESLAARLARRGPLDEAEARRIGAAIADGAAAAHDRGIVHRDLKPGNIMLVADQPRIIDFGIARELAGATVTGSRLGTIAYMAPEQLTGGLVAPCVDVWALGVVLYEALAGRLPFDGFADGRTPQLFETPPRLGGLATVSPSLEAVIASCLSRDPAGRPPSMHAVAQALRAPASDQRITEPLDPAAGRADPAAFDAVRAATHTLPPAPRRRPARRRIAALAALAIAAITTIAVGWRLRAPGSRDRDAASNTALVESPPAVASPAIASPAVASPAVASPAVPAADAPTAPTAAAPVPPPPASFTVEVHSAPSGAQIIVGGKRVGTTPATIALAAPASILVSRAGYRAARVRAERAGAIDVHLIPTRPARSRRPAAGETLD